MLLPGILAAFTAFCVYTAYIAGKSGNMQSAWFFIAFSFFFVIPLAVIIVKALGKRDPGFRKLYDKLAGPQQERVRLIPHWLTMLLILIFVIILAVNIIKIVFWFAK